MVMFCKTLLTVSKVGVSGNLVPYPWFPFSLPLTAALCNLHTILLTQLLIRPPVIYLPDLIYTYWYLFYSPILCHLTLQSFLTSYSFGL